MAHEMLWIDCGGSCESTRHFWTIRFVGDGGTSSGNISQQVRTREINNTLVQVRSREHQVVYNFLNALLQVMDAALVLRIPDATTLLAIRDTSCARILPMYFERRPRVLVVVLLYFLARLQAPFGHPDDQT